MSTPPAAPAAKSPRRSRRLVIPLVLLVLLVAAGVVFYVRGTWADDVPRNPTSVAEGPVAQVYQPAGQGRRVRCAILLPHPPARVWKMVTDYEHYTDFLPYLADVKAERTAEGIRMSGQARSVLGGWWPYTITIHEKAADGGHVAWWDETGAG